MTNTTPYPHRFRRYGGRNVHAARPINGDPNDLVSACGYLAGPKDERKPDDTPVTCRATACRNAAGGEAR